MDEMETCLGGKREGFIYNLERMRAEVAPFDAAVEKELQEATERLAQMEVPAEAEHVIQDSDLAPEVTVGGSI
jgi:hypothetical protein